MMQAWHTKDFVLAGILAALTFAIAFLLGAGVIFATGIPATGGIANIFVAVFILIIGMKLVPKFGFATLTLGLLFTMAIPTVIGGPPGVHKILNGLVIGFVADLVMAAGRRTRLAHIVAGSLGSVTSILSIYVVLILFQLPGVEKLKPLLLPLTLFQAVMGALGAWGALALFDRRLSKLSVVKRFAYAPGQENKT